MNVVVCAKWLRPWLSVSPAAGMTYRRPNTFAGMLDELKIELKHPAASIYKAKDL